jgi:hypothetical protein
MWRGSLVGEIREWNKSTIVVDEQQAAPGMYVSLMDFSKLQLFR